MATTCLLRGECVNCHMNCEYRPLRDRIAQLEEGLRRIINEVPPRVEVETGSIHHWMREIAEEHLYG